MKPSEFFIQVDSSVALAKIIFNYLFTKYESKKISDFAKTTSGGTPQRSISVYYDGTIPWIKSGELNDGLIAEAEETITEEALQNSSAKLYPKGTLVIALYGATVGKVGILDFDSASNQAVCAIYPNSSVDKKYLFWFLRQQRLDFINSSFGGAQPNISQTVVKKTEVPIPPREVQMDIIKLLDEYEKSKSLNHNEILGDIRTKLDKYSISKCSYDLIVKNNQSNRSYIKELRQAILSEAVQGRLVPQDPNDEPASVLLKKIRKEKERLIKEKKIRKEKPSNPIIDTEIEFEIPISWKFVRLQDICSLITDGTHLTPKYTQTGRPFLSAQNVKPFKFMPENHRHVSEEDYQNYIKNRKPELNDILLTRVGAGIGEATVIDKEIDFAIYVSIALIKAFENYINPNYLVIWLNSPVGREKSSSNTYGVGHSQGNLNLSLIRNFLISIPPLKEQKRIVEKVDQLMSYCDQLESQIKENQKTLEALMNAVLREAFVV